MFGADREVRRRRGAEPRQEAGSSGSPGTAAQRLAESGAAADLPWPQTVTKIAGHVKVKRPLDVDYYFLSLSELRDCCVTAPATPPTAPLTSRSATFWLDATRSCRRRPA